MSVKISYRCNTTSLFTDPIIDAAQNFLKQISPVPGLESAAFSLTMTFAVQLGEFVQILRKCWT